MVVGHFPHVGQFLSEGLDRLKIQAESAIEHIVAPNFLRFQFPVRGAAVSRIAVPALRQFLHCFRNVHGYGDPLFPQDTQDLPGGRLLAGVIHIDVLQRAAHIKQNGIDHNLTAFSRVPPP